MYHFIKQFSTYKSFICNNVKFQSDCKYILSVNYKNKYDKCGEKLTYFTKNYNWKYNIFS